MLGEMIEITAKDEYVFDAFQVIPQGNVKGGLAVLQKIFGMTEQLKNVTRFWAKQGYNTLLPTMYDRISLDMILEFSDIHTAQAMGKKLKPVIVLKDITASVITMENDGGVSLIGFCWGGGAATRMANLLDLRGSVSYYGTMLADNTANGANCATLFHYGLTDPHSPPKVVADVKEKNPDAKTYIYETGHAFSNDARPSFYAEVATLEARSRTLDFLNRSHQA